DPCLGLSVSGVSIKAILSTAGDFSIRLDQADFARVSRELKTEPRIRPVPATDADGEKVGTRYVSAPVHIAERDIADIVITAANRKWKDSAIGIYLLRRFNCEIDLKNNSIAF